MASVSSLTNKDIISLLQRFGSKFEQPDAELGLASRMCTKLINKSVNMRPNLNNLSGEKEALSLLELNTRIRGALSRAFPETCWVRAEMSDVRVNTSSGHCYLEFVEKNVQTGQLVARYEGLSGRRRFVC